VQIDFKQLINNDRVDAALGTDTNQDMEEEAKGIGCSQTQKYVGIG